MGEHAPRSRDVIVRVDPALIDVLTRIAVALEARPGRSEPKSLAVVVAAIVAALPGETFSSTEAFSMPGVARACRDAGILTAHGLGKHLQAAADRGTHGVVRIKRDRLGTTWAIEEPA